MSEIRRTGAEDECFGPDWDADHDREDTPRQRCDDNLSPECVDDGRFQVWDGAQIINLCRPCWRVFENRQTNHDQRFPYMLGGVPYKAGV